jgi:hypothetical protein
MFDGTRRTSRPAHLDRVHLTSSFRQKSSFSVDAETLQSGSNLRRFGPALADGYKSQAPRATVGVPMFLVRARRDAFLVVASWAVRLSWVPEIHFTAWPRLLCVAHRSPRQSPQYARTSIQLSDSPGVKSIVLRRMITDDHAFGLACVDYEYRLRCRALK